MSFLSPELPEEKPMWEVPIDYLKLKSDLTASIEREKTLQRQISKLEHPSVPCAGWREVGIAGKREFVEDDCDCGAESSDAIKSVSDQLTEALITVDRLNDSLAKEHENYLATHRGRGRMMELKKRSPDSMQDYYAEKILELQSKLASRDAALKRANRGLESILKHQVNINLGMTIEGMKLTAEETLIAIKELGLE